MTYTPLFEASTIERFDAEGNPTKAETARAGDRRAGSEAVLGLAVAAAGLGDDELSVRLDRIQRDLFAEAGYVYWPQVGEPLDRRVQVARVLVGHPCDPFDELAIDACP